MRNQHYEVWTYWGAWRAKWSTFKKSKQRTFMLLTKFWLNKHIPWTGQDSFSVCCHLHTTGRPRSLWYHRLPSVLWYSPVLPGIPSAIWLFVVLTKKQRMNTSQHKCFSSWLPFKVQKATKHLYSSESQPWWMSCSTKIWSVDIWVSKTPQ